MRTKILRYLSEYETYGKVVYFWQYDDKSNRQATGSYNTRHHRLRIISFFFLLLEYRLFLMLAKYTSRLIVPSVFGFLLVCPHVSEFTRRGFGIITTGKNLQCNSPIVAYIFQFSDCSFMIYQAFTNW